MDLQDGVRLEVLLVQPAIEGVQMLRPEPIKGGAPRRLAALARSAAGRAAWGPVGPPTARAARRTSRCRVTSSVSG
ncbi:hypothetical protein IMZ11_37900 [Microtetraspora sp. AC03309]|uniref:hypothetical protein n=1 Tax=Microtetraspora sp. AC03309 TaxID=2779376 RepID=UPI001E587875|nr:hypothetical protein [Microtetraspora sp. AC03309]MCC5581393.1 hypothetical protein [Microtetraspora sp. AC03309]